MNKTLKRVLYLILVFAIIFIIIYPKLNLGKKGNAAVATEAPKQILGVTTLAIKKMPLDYSVKVTGNILADESVDINSEVSAKVEKIFFKEGQNIKQGQLLLTLNDDELKAELEKLKLTKKRSEDNEFRQRQLLAREAISQDEYEISLTTLKTSIADIKLLEVRMSKYKIHAPFSGKIGLREISEGSYINTGTRIVTLYSIDPVKLDFAIPGRYLNDVNPGDKVRFMVDASNEVFEGEIYAIEPQIDPQTRSIKLRATSRNPDGKLLPGQFAKITLILETINNAILIPSQTIIPELDAMRVFVYNEGTVESRIIDTGIRNEEDVQVLKGLEEGDILITSGLMQIRQGMKVKQIK